MHSRGRLRSGRRKWRGKILRGGSIRRSSRGSRIWRVNKRGLRKRPRLQRQGKGRKKYLLNSAESFKRKNISQSNKELSLRNAALHKKLPKHKLHTKNLNKLKQ